MDNIANKIRLFNMRSSGPGEDKIFFRILLLLPILNAIADSTIYYFVDAYSNSLHPGIIRGAILVFFILAFGFNRIKKNAPNYLVLVFLIYLFLLSILSSDVNRSLFDGYIKWFVAMMMFPAGYYFLRCYDDILKFNLSLFLGAAMVCLNLFIAQMIGFGISAYGGEEFYTGGAGVGITNQLALILLTYPVLIRNFKRFNVILRWFIIITGIISFVFLLLAMKRAGIIALLGGGLVFIFLTQSRRRVIRYLIAGVFVIIITLPIYKEMLVKRYEARMDTMEQYDREARYLEVFYVLDEFKSGSIWQKLFGKEVFNTGQFFGMKYFNRPRMIHGDFAALLYGTGLLGLSMYFAIFYVFFRKGYLKLKAVKNDKPGRELLAVFFGLLFATFLISATGSGTVGERCLVYTYFGAVLGYLYSFQTVAVKTRNNNGSNTDKQ